MTDFLTLLKRDHRDLECGLQELVDAVTVAQLRGALDGVRLGLTAHAEAQDIVLHGALSRAEARDTLEALVGRARTAHLAQEGALAALVCTPPGSPIWRDRVRALKKMIRDHAVYEEQTIVPAIQRLVPDAYAGLAGAFATERLRQLSQLQPSAPLYAMPAFARAS